MQDTGTVVLHNVPLSIHRHAAYKKNEACSHFQQEAKRGTNKTSQVSCFILPFLRQHRFALEGFMHFLIPPSHSGQSHNAGIPPVRFTCVWHSQGRSKPNSSHFLSMWFVLASFYPEAQTFRTVQSPVLEFFLRLLWYSIIPQNKRHGVRAYLKNSVWSRL